MPAYYLTAGIQTEGGGDIYSEYASFAIRRRLYVGVEATSRQAEYDVLALSLITANIR